MTFLLKSGGFSNSLHGNSESLLGSNSSNTVQPAVATDAKSLSDNTIKESASPKVVKMLKSQDIHLQSAPNSIQDPSADDVDQSSTISSLSGPRRPEEWKMNNDVENLIIKTEDDGGPSCIQIKSVKSLNPASVASESSYQNSVNDNDGDENEIENSWNKSDGSRDAIHEDSSNDVDATNDNKNSISKFQEVNENSNETPTNPHPYKKSAASLPFQRVNFEKITSQSRSPSVSRKRTSLPRASSYLPPPPPVPSLHSENEPVPIKPKFDPIMGTYYSCPNCENKFFTSDCVQEHLPSCSGTPSKNYSTRSDRKKNRRADFKYESDYSDSESDDSSIIKIDDDDDDEPPLKRQLRNRTRVTKSYKCGLGLCMRVFDNEDDFYKHRRTSHPEQIKSKARNRPGPKSKKNKTAEPANNTFPCNFCDESFLLKSALEEHEKKSHVNEYPYVCDVCADCFSSEPDLNSHNDEHHPDPASNSSGGLTNGDSPSFNSSPLDLDHQKRNETSTTPSSTPSSKGKQRNGIRNRMKQKNESLSGNITAYVELD